MNKHSTFESAIVRILAEDYELVGIGLLVDANHIVTCAHVVSDALYSIQDTENVPTQNVLFNFLHTNQDHILEARIKVWDHDNDICVLEYSDQLPAGIAPQLMIKGGELADHHFEVYGVPRKTDVGIWSTGILRRSISGGNIHVEDVNSFGYFIEPGFSGAPVWDKSLEGYVGIIGAADRDPEQRTAFMIPAAKIHQIWPSLPCIFLKEDNDSKIMPSKLEAPYGTVPVDSMYYVERKVDSECLNEFLQGGRVTVYVQAPRQMGKSSLMQRTLYQIQKVQPVHYAFIDFEVFEQQQLMDLDQFLIEFCYMVSEELNIPEKVESYWSNTNRSRLRKCTTYISKHILAQILDPVIIALDEVERVLGTPWQDDFFGMLRAWHNAGAYKPDFARMSLFLSSSTEPQLFIKNPNQSPFNVAQTIELENFSSDDVQFLCQRHGIELTAQQLDTMMKLLEGHPFLIRAALYQLAFQRYDFDDLIGSATSDNGPFGNHLSRIKEQLIQTSGLSDIVSQICQGRTRSLEDVIYTRLKGAGLVKKVNDKVIMSNRLYEQYFKQHL